MLEYYNALSKSAMVRPRVEAADPAHASPGADTFGDTECKYGVCEVLTPACESMFLASRIVADFFGIHNLDKEFYELWEDYAHLSKNHSPASGPDSPVPDVAHSG